MMMMHVADTLWIDTAPRKCLQLEKTTESWRYLYCLLSEISQSI